MHTPSDRTAASRGNILLTLGVTIVWAAATTAAPSPPQAVHKERPTLDLYSLAQEMAIGEKMASELERFLPIDADPQVRTYVQHLADRIARQADLQMPVQVVLVDSPAADAFALPGGYLFVDTGLILLSRSEAELAGILAHEVGHIAARHATRALTRQKLWQWASWPLLLLAGPVPYTAEQVLNVVAPLPLLHFSRAAEKEADQLGLEYMFAAGYDPAAMVIMLERMQQVRQQAELPLGRLWSTHPAGRDRIAWAERFIQNRLGNREAYVVTTSDYERIRLHVLERVEQERPIVELPRRSDRKHKTD